MSYTYMVRPFRKTGELTEYSLPAESLLLRRRRCLEILHPPARDMYKGAKGEPGKQHGAVHPG